MLAAGTSAEQASKKLALTVLKEKAIDLEFDPVHGEPGGDRRLAIEQQFATQQAAIATQNRVQVAAQRDALGWLGLGLVLCFTAVGAAGVVLSHRITGPLYRMGKILDEVSTGNLSFLHRPLRRGDLLGAFYDRFCAMFDTMRTQQLDELAQLDAMMIAAERSDLGAVMASLQALRKQKQATLGLPEGSLGMLSVAPVPVSASKPVQLQRE